MAAAPAAAAVVVAAAVMVALEVAAVVLLRLWEGLVECPLQVLLVQVLVVVRERELVRHRIAPRPHLPPAQLLQLVRLLLAQLLAVPLAVLQAVVAAAAGASQLPVAA